MSEIVQEHVVNAQIKLQDKFSYSALVLEKMNFEIWKCSRVVRQILQQNKDPKVGGFYRDNFFFLLSLDMTASSRYFN